MDDYKLATLQESNNEWVCRLVSVLTPCMIEGIKGILMESTKLCIENDEREKYLMTFQNFLTRVPKWSGETLAQEVERISESSGCDYLNDLITCVHVIQLKALSVIRVGQQQKKVNIDIPKLDAFIHRAYTLLARKVYANVYLFEANLAPLQIQRNYRELEVITKDCIMEAIRESIPVNEILRAYLDDTIEEAVETKVEEKILETTPVEEPATATATSTASASAIPSTANEVIAVPTEGITTSPAAASTTEPAIAITAPIPGESGPSQTIAFNEEDEHQSAEDSTIKRVSAPKDVATLDQISDANHARRMAEESDEEDDEDEDRIQIHTESTEVNPIELNIQTI
jgi:hypothetical protein